MCLGEQIIAQSIRPCLVHQNYNEKWLYSFPAEFTFCAFAIHFLLTRCPLYVTILEMINNLLFIPEIGKVRLLNAWGYQLNFLSLQYKIVRILVICMLKALQWYTYDLDISLSSFIIVRLYIYTVEIMIFLWINYIF